MSIPRVRLSTEGRDGDGLEGALHLTVAVGVLGVRARVAGPVEGPGPGCQLGAVTRLSECLL